jgi:hypothetical protein
MTETARASSAIDRRNRLGFAVKFAVRDERERGRWFAQLERFGRPAIRGRQPALDLARVVRISEEGDLAELGFASSVSIIGSRSTSRS